MGKPKESSKLFEKSSSNLSNCGGISKKKLVLKEYKEKKQLAKIESALKRRPSFRQCVPRGKWLEKESIIVVPKSKEVHLSKDLIAEITIDNKILKKTPTKELIAKARKEIVDMGKREASKRALFTRSLAVDLSF